jgi:nucleoside-diphosphate-sugar epimerase
MRFLVLGGTAWLGHTVAAAALHAGHQVTCVARGTGVPSAASLVQADRDDEDALAAVARSQWDAVVDVARQPGHVRRAVRDLSSVADRFVFVSTGNVYASQAEIGGDEDAALLDPLDGDSMASLDEYGPAKVACENAVLDGFGAQRAAITRAGLIGGPGDPSGRTGYWPLRFAHPSNPQGRVVVPDVPDLPTALIDVRDLANWIVRLAEGKAHGVFNAVGTPLPYPEHIEVARTVAGHTGPIVLATPDWLIDHGVAEWSGPRSLPLWLADQSWYGMNTRSNARALAAGLILRPLSETLADSLAWDLRHFDGVARGAGLTDVDERELLADLNS